MTPFSITDYLPDVIRSATLIQHVISIAGVLRLGVEIRRTVVSPGQPEQLVRISSCEVAGSAQPLVPGERIELPCDASEASVLPLNEPG